MCQARVGFCLAVVISMSLVPVFALAKPPAATPALPQHYVDTAYTPVSGRILRVRRGGNFQAALDTAKPGDVIELEAGATFTGPFVLPVKPGSEWIVVRSSATEGRLPAPGTRVNPTHAGAMPKLVTASGPVIVTKPGAHHYRFIGLEISPAPSGDASGREASRSLWQRATGREHSRQTLVSLGTAETSVEHLPHHIIFDRCYFHGDAKYGARRGIAMNSRHTAVIDSYLSDFKTVGEDSQAISGWNGSGPFKISNNYLEGAGENVMFGGADPAIRNLVPADIEIRGNHFSKPLSWKEGRPDYAGTPWAVKNLFELKNARRVLIDGNLLEHNWPHGQNGYAILFTVRNQDGAAPWSVVEDVTFTNNILRHVASGINILGRDNVHPSQPTRRILIKNNLFDDVGGRWGPGQLLQLLDGTEDVVITHNTALQTASLVLGGEGQAHPGFVLSDNIAPHNEYGIIGSGTGVGHPSLERYFPGAVVRKNVMVGGSAHQYPTGNFFPNSLHQVGFMDRSHRDYRLGRASRFKGAASDGKDIGADFETLCAALLTMRPPATDIAVCPPRGH